jgi:heptosyltransferase-2
MSAAVAEAVPACIVATNRLDWQALVALISGAELVYSVETSIGHVAVATGRPVVAIYGGMADPLHWKPYGDAAALVTHETPCHPCFRKQGCATRDCLTMVSLDDVFSAGERLLLAGP